MNYPHKNHAVNGHAMHGNSTHSTKSKNLNIIVPIGGIGSRFAKQGYRFPKPLINIVGRPMLLWMIDNLSLTKDDKLWIAVNEEIDDEFRIGQLVLKSFPELNLQFLRLRHQTKGACETLFIATQSMNEEDLQRRTLSLDCDTIYWSDILQKVRDLPPQYSGCFYFQDSGDKPIFSYVKTRSEENLELVTDIQEKKAISNKANSGAYLFSSAQLLRHWAARTIDAVAARPEAIDVGEYYTSHIIAAMITEGHLPFIGIPLAQSDFDCVGTPEQLETLLLKIKRENQISKKKRRFCFDLDMTLVGAPAVHGDYSSCPPIWKNIELVQQLYDAGHHIIIQTARRMRTHNGNVGAVLADVGPVTFAQLARYRIPFHDIHFGKPHADVYIDDLAVNANLDTMREIGWLLEIVPSPAPTPKHGERHEPSMIAARDFNTIQIVGDKVVKSSKAEAILGEIYFYAHLPTSLRRVFPAVYNVDYLSETATYTITMENRRGLTFSHLLVGRSITQGRLLALLRALHSIHSTPGLGERGLEISPALEERFGDQGAHSNSGDAAKGSTKSETETPPVKPNIYANYSQKLHARYTAHRALYDGLGPLAAQLYARLAEFLDTYEAEDKGVRCAVIHGDPVFSNVIMSGDEKLVSFIDVRGWLDGRLTMEGDLHYDLAKVLQSLLGYDFVLFRDDAEEREGRLGGGGSSDGDGRRGGEGVADGPVGLGLLSCDIALLSSLQDTFWSFLESTYQVKIHRKTLLRVTASLFFTLIPLHKPSLGRVFLAMCQRTLEMAGEIGYSNAVVESGGMDRAEEVMGGKDEKAEGEGW